MVAWQDPNLTSSHGHNKFTITYEIISSEKRPDNQMNRAPTTKDKRVVLKQIEHSIAKTMQNKTVTKPRSGDG